ncbi:MAG TPA: DMT family transporter [Burkholderiales bacterium]|nr:DMT family transporter [Burkholderiales bacterium]
MQAADPQHPHRRAMRGVVLILCAVFMFSAMDTLAKYMLQSFPMSGLMWARYMVHATVMAVLLWPRMGMQLVRTGRPFLQVLRGLLLVLSTVFFYFALRYMPLAEAAAISFVGPVLTTLLAGPMLGDRVSGRQWLAVGLGFVGVLIIMRPGGGVLSLPAVFPLATAILFSVYQIITRKLAGREHPYTTLFYTAMVGAIVTSFAAPLNWVTPTWIQAGLMVCIGVLGGTGHLLLIRAMEYASPSALAPYIYSQLVWSTLLAYLAFGDFPQTVTLVGMLVVVAAGLLAVNWRQMRRLSDAADQARTHGD